jgi:hypothetical protein
MKGRPELRGDAAESSACSTFETPQVTQRECMLVGANAEKRDSYPNPCSCILLRRLSGRISVHTSSI